MLQGVLISARRGGGPLPPGAPLSICDKDVLTDLTTSIGFYDQVVVICNAEARRSRAFCRAAVQRNPSSSKRVVEEEDADKNEGFCNYSIIGE